MTGARTLEAIRDIPRSCTCRWVPRWGRSARRFVRVTARRSCPWHRAPELSVYLPGPGDHPGPGGTLKGGTQ